MNETNNRRSERRMSSLYSCQTLERKSKGVTEIDRITLHMAKTLENRKTSAIVASIH